MEAHDGGDMLSPLKRKKDKSMKHKRKHERQSRAVDKRISNEVRDVPPDRQVGLGGADGEGKSYDTEEANASLAKDEEGEEGEEGPSGAAPSDSTLVIMSERRAISLLEKSGRGKIISEDHEKNLNPEVNTDYDIAANALTDLHRDGQNQNKALISSSSLSKRAKLGSGHSGYCSKCENPIANRISAGLKEYNASHTYEERVCQTCFKCMFLPQKQINAIETNLIVEQGTYLPWFQNHKNMECLQNFSMMEILDTTKFYVSYNYNASLSERMHMEIIIENVTESTADLKAKASTGDLGKLRMYTPNYPVGLHTCAGEESLLGTITHHSWIWPRIPLNITRHCLRISEFQRLTGSILGSPVQMSHAGHQGTSRMVHLFITNANKLVFYPYVYPVDVEFRFLGNPVDFGGSVVIDDRFLKDESDKEEPHPYSNIVASHIHLIGNCPGEQKSYMYIDFTIFREVTAGQFCQMTQSRVFETSCKIIQSYGALRKIYDTFTKQNPNLEEVKWPDICDSPFLVLPDQILTLRRYLNSKNSTGGRILK